MIIVARFIHSNQKSRINDNVHEVISLEMIGSAHPASLCDVMWCADCKKIARPYRGSAKHTYKHLSTYKTHRWCALLFFGSMATGKLLFLLLLLLLLICRVCSFALFSSYLFLFLCEFNRNLFCTHGLETRLLMMCNVFSLCIN